ncbi:MAG TPA: hypothetical protein VFP12_09910 [Allosphingosinicella sp.]|nr:hypothetical protein [Allosphingosinicella sp.]
MDDTDFDVIRAEIDRHIDSDSSGRLGVAMGFRLAGEFLKRGLLTTVKFTLLIDWEARTYRDRYVYPDPLMDDYEYRLGRP